MKFETWDTIQFNDNDTSANSSVVYRERKFFDILDEALEAAKRAALHSREDIEVKTVVAVVKFPTLSETDLIVETN